MEELSEDVLKLAAQGDMTAFRKIYEAVSGFVYSVALRMVRNTADAQEITQDVFLKIYHNLKNFQYRSSFKTWAYQITLNTTLNYCKRLARERNRRTDDSVLATQGVSPAVEERMEQLSREATVQSLLAILTPEQRACIVLREIENLSYEEMATVLRLNINTVRTRLKRARQRLIEYAKKGVAQHGL
ncbi:MAG: RNA polymerase sigma factor [Candidatus Omnitrophica bacterium]|nr:RNA polymerase sigma factor [Candidatus Omnitrophota bacterium]